MAPMRAQISQSRFLNDIERVQATIARIEAKRDAATDEGSRWYYAQCVIGWRAWLKKLAAGLH